MKRAYYYPALLAILLSGAALRLPRLEERPMHGDEAVHADKFLDLWENGKYVYDPHEYHGPTLNYFTLPVAWAFGVPDRAALSEAHLRLLPVVFGLAAILLCALLRDGLGSCATLVAALLLAIAPPYVFYSRYYIQETLLLCFTLAAIGCGWRYAVSRRVGWAIGCGAALGLMHATKETCVISFAGLAIAWLLASRGRLQLRANAAHYVAGGAAAVLVSGAFFSSFGTNWRGVLDSVGMLSVYANRAGGADHDQSWWYFLPFLSFWQARGGPLFFGGLIPLLGLLGLWGFKRRRTEVQPGVVGGIATPVLPNHTLFRFAGWYSLVLLLAYSAIPYKTPWCILQPLLGLTLLAGCGAQLGLAAGAPPYLRASVAILLLAGGPLAAWQSYVAAFKLSADQRNPFVYSHPLRDVLELQNWLERLAQYAPDGRAMRINAIVENPWPLPWYLRTFPQVGWWERLPDGRVDLDAPVLMVDENLEEALTKRLTQTYQISLYGLRPNETVAVYVRQDIYDRFRDAARNAAQIEAESP